MKTNELNRSYQMFNRRLLSIFLLLLTGVSGCSAKEPSSDSTDLFDGRYWKNTDDYYGEDLVFDLLDSSYLDNRDVFIVQNEMELALLLTIFYQEGAYEVYYVSTRDLDLNRVYSYTLSINEQDIWWEDYFYTLEDDTVINSAEFVYDFEMIHNINQAVDEWTHSYNSSDFTQEDSILFL